MFWGHHFRFQSIYKKQDNVQVRFRWKCTVIQIHGQSDVRHQDLLQVTCSYLAEMNRERVQYRLIRFSCVRRNRPVRFLLSVWLGKESMERLNATLIDHIAYLEELLEKVGKVIPTVMMVSVVVCSVTLIPTLFILCRRAPCRQSSLDMRRRSLGVSVLSGRGLRPSHSGLLLKHWPSRPKYILLHVSTSGW